MIPLLWRELQTWSRLRDVFTLCKARPRARTVSCISDNFAWTRGRVFLTYSAALDDFPLLFECSWRTSLFPYTAVYKVLYGHKSICIHKIYVFPNISYPSYISRTPDQAESEKVSTIIVVCIPSPASSLNVSLSEGRAHSQDYLLAAGSRNHRLSEMRSVRHSSSEPGGHGWPKRIYLAMNTSDCSVYVYPLTNC